MRFDIISIFPESFKSYFNVSILKRAQEDGKINIVTHDPRNYATDKHRTVDDTPYGGGPGMILKIEPLVHALEDLKKSDESVATRTILFSAKGKRYTQADAVRLSNYERLILICGRYEGVDERLAENYIDEEISIGDYVLTGGEVPAMAVVDSVARLIPQVLGNSESLAEESHGATHNIEYPQYTKPEVFEGHTVPGVLLSGNHGNIKKWRDDTARNTYQKRAS